MAGGGGGLCEQQQRRLAVRSRNSMGSSLTQRKTLRRTNAYNWRHAITRQRNPVLSVQALLE